MKEWKARTLRMAKPRKLCRAKLVLDTLMLGSVELDTETCRTIISRGRGSIRYCLPCLQPAHQVGVPAAISHDLDKPPGKRSRRLESIQRSCRNPELIA